MVTYKNLPGVKDVRMNDDFPRWLDQTVHELTLANQEIYREAVKAHRKLVTDATWIYGGNSNEVKYLLKHEVPAPPKLEQRANVLRGRYNSWLGEKRKAQEKADRERRQKEARELLKQEGFIAGISYPKTAPLKTLKELTQSGEIPDGP